MEHHFNVDLAIRFGVEKAVIIQNLYFWINHNAKNKKHIYDDSVWTFNSSTAFAKLFPYIKGRTIARYLIELEKDNIIKSGNHNDNPFDKTKWYSFTNSFLCELNDLGYDISEMMYCQNIQLDTHKLANRESENGEPIPYNKHTDSKHEETVKDKSFTKKKTSDSAWRESMEEYLKEVEKAKEELIEDADFKNKFLGMFPNADYLRSIMKSMQYWTSEKAWELKKKSKTKKINMLSTLKNNLDKSIVYKNQQDAPIENLRMLDIEYSDQEEGTLADGTFIKNGYRYYFSYKDKRAYSIPIKAPRMPGEKCEFDMKTNQWYLPRESETIDEWLW